MKKEIWAVIFAMFISMFCVVGLRPDNAVEATVGRASIATVESDYNIRSLQESYTPFIVGEMPKPTPMTLPPTTIPPTTIPPSTLPPTVPPPTVPPTTVPPTTEPVVSGNGDPNDYGSWDRLAQCESGGNWSINTGNGYYGGLQFSLSSWRAVGGTGYPHEHSREHQIAMAQRLHAQGGWRHWPGCSRKFGWI